MRYFSAFFLLIFLSACTATQYVHKSDRNWSEESNSQNGELLYSLYMIGDVGDDPSLSGPVLNGLKARLAEGDPEASGVVFLGDNIYPAGLHKKSSDNRAQDEARIDIQLEAVKDFQGKIVFIPGNHDWDHHGKDGWKHVKRQEKYVEDFLDRGNVFVPNDGCPGPKVVKLTPGLVMVVIDTQWWLHPFERPSGEKDGCEARNPEEFMVLFKDVLKKYRNQNVIVAAHHPLYSNGNHGGHYPIKDHIFPLTAIKDKAYVPLPVLGSLYPYYRKFFGHRQDIPHPVYQDMKNQLVTAMNEYENVVYVAGHEHNLQYALEQNVHHIVSGSGSKLTHLKFGSSLNFGARQKGFAQINYYDSGEIWLSFHVLDEEKQQFEETYKKLLFTKEVVRGQDLANVPKVSYKGKFAVVAPDTNLGGSGFKRFWLGDLNRDLWTTPLKVPYLDIHFEKGGLTPIKKGGGMQTLSLRMQGADGKQYTLRGIKKNTTFLTTKNMRGTIIQDAIYDGMAGSHPYASVVIPPLSRAAGVYHSNPTLVVIPDDPILGDYQEEFGGMFCLFEERPDGDMSDASSFGNSEKVMNYKDAIHKMHTKYKHVVDQDYLVRARLFDCLIGDWDRHDDQWRWGTFKEGDWTYYRPIPRDRDQAFFEFDGVFMWVANRKWVVRKFQPFSPDVRDMGGQNFNARYFDRSFLIGAEREDWIRIAEDLQAKMTDAVLEEAIKGFPPEGYDLTGEEIVETLKLRRDNLVKFAERFYEILAREVSIPGTLKDDLFVVDRKEDGTVEVSIYPLKKGEKDVEHRYFHRVFQPDETREIRLYGLEGEDQYEITGESKKSIMVRVVGGFDKDEYKDGSRVSGMRKLTKIYETDGKNSFEKGRETRVKTMPEPTAYDYDRKDFVYNMLSPVPSLGFNPNDGIYLGGGVKYVNHGFKKEPYKSSHTVKAHYAFGSEGVHFAYDYDFIDLIGKADISGKLRITTPLVFLYFGAGNEAEVVTTELAPYRVRMNHYQYQPAIRFANSTQTQSISIGANLERNAFEVPPLAPVDAWQLDPQNFLGANAEYVFQNKDDQIFPTRGLEFRAGALYNTSLGNDSVNYFKLRSELRLYLPINLWKKNLTLNLRSGVEHNIGDYAFYQASFLSGFSNFRGVQRNRFSGRTSTFHNAEIRASLLKVKNYVAPFDIGVLGHFDVARVWEDGENSDLWHRSYGGGVFLNILDSFMLSGTYSISDADEVLLIGGNFFF